MRTVAIINQKGGCGKTTTSINLAACLARLGHKTLLVDMDPQGHCGVGLAVPEDQVERTIYDALIEPSDGKCAEIGQIVWQIATDFDLAPANIRLAAFEQVFSHRPGRDERLRRALDRVKNNYQWCVIDCPPSVGLLTFNALQAADQVIVPVETGYFSLHGLVKMMETLEVMRQRCGREIVIRILPTLYDTRTKLAREVLSELRARFKNYLMDSAVNFNTKLKEAASFGQPITEYDPGSRGYKDFANLARELMGQGAADTKPVSDEKLSRPAELVQRAKQLAQLTNAQFGRGTILVPATAPSPASKPIPSIQLPAVSKVEPPAVSKVEPPAVSRIEPPAVSKTEPPSKSRVELPAVSRLELPPAAPAKSPTIRLPDPIEELNFFAEEFASFGLAESDEITGIPTSPVINRTPPPAQKEVQPPAPSMLQSLAKNPVQPFSTSPTQATMMNRIESPASKAELPAVSKVAPPAVSRAEPPAVSLVKPPPVSFVGLPAGPRFEQPVVARVPTPAAKRPDASSFKPVASPVMNTIESPAPAPLDFPEPQQHIMRLTAASWPPTTDLVQPNRQIHSISLVGTPSQSTLNVSAFSAATAPEIKTTRQKIEEFYGAKQVGAEVLFAAHFDKARTVLLAGDFNNWTPQATPMNTGDRPGDWRKVLSLKPGRYKYRLVVDGKWITDPNNKYVETNQFGELDNVVEVERVTSALAA